MPELDIEEVPTGKVYQTTNIGIATFFGGLLVGAYLLSENFKTLGDKRKATLTWAIAGLLLVFLIASMFIPALDRLPKAAYTLLIALLARGAAKHYQEAKIKAHIQKGGDVYPTKRVIAVTVIGVAILVVFVLVLLIAQDFFTFSK